MGVTPVDAGPLWSPVIESFAQLIASLAYEQRQGLDPV